MTWLEHAPLITMLPLVGHQREPRPMSWHEQKRLLPALPAHLWHSTRSMTHHYNVAQIVELHSALEQIKDDSGRWNKSLAMLKLEQKRQPAGASPAKVRTKEKRLTGPSS